MELDKSKAVRILYTNYRGETALRVVYPERIVFDATDWHPKEQWLLEAFDEDRNAIRLFAMKDIKAWLEME